MKLRFYIFLFFWITSISNLKAQENSVSFEAILSKKSLGINEKLRVDFKMNKDGDNFTPPNFTGFKVVGGPNQSVSNGNAIRGTCKKMTRVTNVASNACPFLTP